MTFSIYTWRSTWKAQIFLCLHTGYFLLPLELTAIIKKSRYNLINAKFEITRKVFVFWGMLVWNKNKLSTTTISIWETGVKCIKLLPHLGQDGQEWRTRKMLWDTRVMDEYFYTSILLYLTARSWIFGWSLCPVHTTPEKKIENETLCFSPLSHLFITVLHSLTLVCGAHKQELNTLKLELNGYGRRPIAALIKLIFPNIISYFSGPAKVRASPQKTTHNTKGNVERPKKMQGRAGRGKKLLLQRVKQMNVTKAIECSIVR